MNQAIDLYWHLWTYQIRMPSGPIQLFSRNRQTLELHPCTTNGWHFLHLNLYLSLYATPLHSFGFFAHLLCTTTKKLVKLAETTFSISKSSKRTLTRAKRSFLFNLCPLAFGHTKSQEICLSGSSNRPTFTIAALNRFRGRLDIQIKLS